MRIKVVKPEEIEFPTNTRLILQIGCRYRIRSRRDNYPNLLPTHGLVGGEIGTLIGRVGGLMVLEMDQPPPRRFITFGTMQVFREVDPERIYAAGPQELVWVGTEPLTPVAPAAPPTDLPAPTFNLTAHQARQLVEVAEKGVVEESVRYHLGLIEELIRDRARAGHRTTPFQIKEPDPIRRRVEVRVEDVLRRAGFEISLETSDPRLVVSW